ncbi:hypothetical protein ACQPZ2_20300 [Nocardia pseudovaccinii]|uniref:hypothetical protein n=1 Tax=Nocardia pseudovaccinii TaxID=189540 RepID=UPI003D8D88DB
MKATSDRASPDASTARAFADAAPDCTPTGAPSDSTAAYAAPDCTSPDAASERTSSDTATDSTSANSIAAFSSTTVRLASAMSRSNLVTIARSSPGSNRDRCITEVSCRVVTAVRCNRVC